jgi:uncharacterized transporter YbjL
MVPAPGTLIQAGDLLHLVGRPEDVEHRHILNRHLVEVGVLHPHVDGVQMGMAVAAAPRLKRGELLMVPAPGTLIQAGDLLHLVGRPEDLHSAHPESPSGGGWGSPPAR